MSVDGKCRTLAVVCTGQAHDVHQYIALAHALQTLGGFKVKLVTHFRFETLAKTFGLSFNGLKGDPTALVHESSFRNAIAEDSILTVASLLKRETDATLEANLGLIHDALKVGVDAIVCSISLLTECLAVGQRYQRPVLLAPLLPYSPSGEIPLAHFISEPAKYTFLNRLSYDVSGALLWSYCGPVYNKFRTDTLGIGPQPYYILEGVPQIAAFSSLVVPPPGDWGPWIHLTGHWELPPHPSFARDVRERSPSLCRVMEAATDAPLLLRPIVIDMEGCPLPDPVAFLRSAHAVGVKHNVSVIVLAGMDSELGSRASTRLADLRDIKFEVDLPKAITPSSAPTTPVMNVASPEKLPRVVVVSSLPLNWVLQRASLLVHQGSAVATQSAMSAGIASVAFPAFGEQHFWAARISTLGVGPPIHYPLREAPARLVECVTVARQPSIVAAAAQFGLQLQGAGDGVLFAAMTVRDILNRPQHRHCGVTCKWEPDESRSTCSLCELPFTLINRRRHCRSCGRLACGRCFTQRCHLPGYPENSPQITCERCLDYRRAFFAKSVGESVVPELPNEAAAQLAASGQQIPESSGARAMHTPLGPKVVVASPDEADTFDGVDLLSDKLSEKTPQRTPALGTKLYSGGGVAKLYASGGGGDAKAETPV
jgi:hypothetical protein